MGGCFSCDFNKNEKKSVSDKVEKMDASGFYEISYLEDGQINALESFENELLNGFSYSFYDNGNVYEQAEFRNGKRIGDNIIYNRDGMLAFYRCFLKPGQIAYQRAYSKGKVVKEEGGFIALETQNIYKEEGDSILSILISTIIPPDCYNVTTDIKVLDENNIVVESVLLEDQEEFVFEMRLNATVKTLKVNCTLHESFLDSVTIFESISDKDSLVNMLENKRD
jgi:hypothetical protein